MPEPLKKTFYTSFQRIQDVIKIKQNLRRFYSELRVEYIPNISLIENVSRKRLGQNI